MQDFAGRIRDLAFQLDGAEARISEAEVILKLLEGVLPKYSVLVTVLEAQSGVLKFEEVVAKLQHEELRRHTTEDKRENAYLGNHQASKHQGKKQAKQIKCFHCGKLGHMKKDCYGFKRQQQHQEQKGKGSGGYDVPKDPHSSAAASKNFAFQTTTRGHLPADQTWYVDSGATKHMCSNQDAFSKLMLITPEPVYMGNNAIVEAVGVGEVPVTMVVEGEELKGHLTNVLYVPELATNLVSVKQIVAKGMQVNFAKNRCNIISAEGKVLGKAQLDGKLYKLQTAETTGHIAASAISSPALEAKRWHERFGHIGMQSLQQLACKEMVTGLPKTISGLGEVCTGCMLGKQSRDAFPSEGNKASEALALVHSDLCGPMKVPSLGKARYFLTFIDDATRFKTLYFLQTKDQVLSKFQEFKALVENSSGKKIKAIRTDRGGEYLNEAFDDFLAKNGIQHDKTAPFTPQQNGVAERANRTLMECARSMLHSKRLPSYLWAEAVATAAFLRNISLTKALSNITPAEAWTGRKPHAENLRIFGCKAFAHIPAERRHKLEAKSKVCVFVGYDLSNKAYRLYDPSKRSIIISRDVAFDESSFADSLEQMQADEEPFPVMLPVLEEEEPQADNVAPAVADVADEQQQGQVPPPQEQPQEFRRSTRERRPPSPYWIANAGERACVAAHEDPPSYKQAIGGPNAKQWEKAMEAELNSIKENGTWSLVPLPAGRKAVGSKWIFRIKRDAAGNIKTWKARLVAKGYSQVEGLDFSETFAPVAKFTSIRIILTLAAAHGWECHHMDVKTAFLNGELEEEIYMEQPEGFVKVGEEHLVCKLVKSLYGLKQAPRAWNKKLHQELTKAGFIRLEADHSVYQKHDATGQVFLLIYVDDLVIVTSTKESLHSCKNGLSKIFKMTDLGETSHFLGMEVQRDRKKNQIFLNQTTYIKAMLERLGMAECAPLKIPLAVGAKLPPCSTEQKPYLQYFQSAVGSLMYLMVATRPDLAYAVGAVSQFMASPDDEHLAAVKRVLRYVRGTMDYKLVLGAGKQGTHLIGYSDADWAANDINRRSISGYCFMLGAGAVSWKSKKQTSVALSSTEAEYMALTQATKEAIWTKQFLTELGLFSNKPIVIRADNQSCISLARNPEFHTRTKHIDIQYHFIREKVENETIHLEYCSTKQMVADVLTKAVPHEKHIWCTEAMGVMPTA